MKTVDRSIRTNIYDALAVYICPLHTHTLLKSRCREGTSPEPPNDGHAIAQSGCLQLCTPTALVPSIHRQLHEKKTRLPFCSRQTSPYQAARGFAREHEEGHHRPYSGGIVLCPHEGLFSSPCRGMSAFRPALGVPMGNCPPWRVVSPKVEVKG